MSNDNQATGHNLDTSDGARAYVAEFFANQVGRHDFRAYITTRLAADFACALAKHLAASQPAGQQPAYNAAGISLTACQLHEALLMAGDPELDVPFEDRSLVRIFSTETGHSGPGLYCECVDAEEEGCILLDGTAPAIRQAAQTVDLVRARDSIQALLNWIDDWAETPEESGLDPIAERALEVVAQIDAQVYAGEPNSETNRLTDQAQPPLFYIQDTRQFVGNCPMWWGPNGSGYVTRLDEAGRYTEQEAIQQNRTRDTDVPWPCAEIDSLARPTVDVQHMRTRGERLAELNMIDSQAVRNG